MRSTDNGDTWSTPIVVDRVFPAGRRPTRRMATACVRVT